MALAGHEFLASLGKTRLRPGGKAGTEFLLQNCPLTSTSQVLEVACNRAYNLIELAKRFDCNIVGVDCAESAIQQAAINIQRAGLTSNCRVLLADARKLPFADASFDVVINEAMLTMLAPPARNEALREYKRVLKPKGYLLTHDVCLLREDNKALNRELVQAIKHPAYPCTLAKWQDYLQTAGFAVQTYKTGKLSLTSPLGLIKDEGLLRTLQIIMRGLQAENRAYFLRLFRFFSEKRHNLNYVAFVAQSK